MPAVKPFSPRIHAETLSAVKNIAACMRIPKAIESLFSIVVPMLPPDLCVKIPDALMLCKQPKKYMATVDRLFLIWLIDDPIYGLKRICRRPDTAPAIASVLHILAQQAIGVSVEDLQKMWARKSADAAQKNAWNAYQMCRENNRHARAEWMGACAIANALEDHPSCLSGTVQSAAVAWCAVIDGNSIASVTDYYIAVHRQLLSLFSTPMAHAQKTVDATVKAESAHVGDSVTFNDPENGPQRGVVAKVVISDATPFAFVQIAENRESAPWRVQLDRLQIEARAA